MSRLPLMTSAALMLTVLASFSAGAESIDFTGTLTRWGSPVEGEVDLRIRIFDGPSAEASVQLGQELSYPGVPIDKGLFRVDLPRPDALIGPNAWLEVDVSSAGWPQSFFTLEPRFQIHYSSDQPGQATTPSGAVVFFDLASCPAGWVEYTSARGRAVVGLTFSGTLAGTVGSALLDLQEPSHNHSYVSSGQTTGISGTHQHYWGRTDGVNGQRWISYNSSGQEIVVTAWGNGVGNEGSGLYPLAKNSSSSQTLSTDNRGGHRHNVGSGITASQTGTLPYVQLLACIKE